MALNILVVDDSLLMRKMIIKTLHLSGIPLGEIYQAANGQEGLQILQEEWVDLLLVDINMPVMNGEVMIDRVRHNPETATLPIIVISTEGSQTRIDLLQKKGAGFVHKPFSPEELRPIILDMTGVTDAQPNGKNSLQGGGPDF
jgi:two-component system chemotaxis response regulator CheY